MLSSYTYKDIELSIITQYNKKTMIISLITQQEEKENIIISKNQQSHEDIKKVLHYTSQQMPAAFNQVINFIYSINKDLFNVLYSEYF